MRPDPSRAIRGDLALGVADCCLTGSRNCAQLLQKLLEALPLYRTKVGRPSLTLNSSSGVNAARPGPFLMLRSFNDVDCRNRFGL